MTASSAHAVLNIALISAFSLNMSEIVCLLISRLKIDQIGSNWILLDQIGSCQNMLSKHTVKNLEKKIRKTKTKFAKQNMQKKKLQNKIVTISYIALGDLDKNGLGKHGLDKFGLDKHFLTWS